jgi:hypothetical protein
VPVEVCPESEDLAPAGRAAGVDGGGGEHGEIVPVSCSISALVPRGGRQQATEGPPWRGAPTLVGEGDDSETQAGSRDVDEEAISARGQAAAAERISAAEERQEGWEDEEEKDQREEATEAGQWPPGRRVRTGIVSRREGVSQLLIVQQQCLMRIVGAFDFSFPNFKETR